ncbi:HNH endonuclease signature motif containing protein [Gordonia sp. NPDC058843]|uniref:HNH endonuclease signature motif containing protein n=1 Tax=Gordonia sp. NPDC058843 TaxID=3346648 RepID=UPI00367EB953
MTITVTARKLLWGRSGSRCAYPSCRTELAHTSDLTGSSVILGEEAHIVARSEDGPRGKEPFEGDRDSYENLILMCPTHHTLIDSVEEDYPAASLSQMKTDQETWVQESLGLDRERLAIELRWAKIVDQFGAQIDLGRWDRTIGSLAYEVEPILSEALVSQLRDLCHWIQVRPWPPGNETVRDSLVGLARVLTDLLDRFMLDAEPINYGESAGRLRYPRWYRIDEWNPELYSRLLQDYKDARRLVDELVYEATRHLNWLMDAVRQCVDAEYREDDGYVYLIADGSVDGDRTLVPRFGDTDVTDGRPYKGLREFLLPVICGTPAPTQTRSRYRWGQGFESPYRLSVSKCWPKGSSTPLRETSIARSIAPFGP